MSVVKLNRGRIEIILDILGQCRTPLCKWNVIYKCNLNAPMFKAYINSLEKKHLLVKVDNKYQTTPEGRSLVADLLFLKPLMR
jgi:predicted transcriptional regulator